ncbi:hypothetical protein RhiirA5_428565 [Rhizophagus irregularis]|uniref:Uncharacterized protein n=1 Tax=Rhizophagus irregularis TaxID=588596 RepID=A0A2N0R3L6_9GLOM|nr:hypothetical protein RhiirA5_428565 [Rhizophagus irregularis]PKC57895.1 hypothetical protein RhiirA1_471793 [Rhizophagus irregularis]CAB4477387.1 unnamed protein product [Rhizophagus irregularis]CAB5179347.1 unnamed protein product [Rhizophagus irregularis]
MSQNTLQNNQNDPTFSNLQSNVIQPEHSSSNTNYYDMNVIPSDNIFPSFYTNTNNSYQQPISNEYTASTLTSPLSYDPQYVSPQHPISPQQSIENIPLLNMTSINPSQSEILSFDIPGFKIIVIPTFSQQDNTYLNYSSSNTTNTQFTQFQQ